MKEFLIKTIENLWALTGVDQEKDLIAKSRKSNGEIEYKNGVHIAVTELLHILLTECNRFKIPDEKKQELIEKGIKSEVASGYFRGLNAGLINKWLYAYKMKHQAFDNRTSCRWDDELAARAKQNEIDARARLAEKKKADPNYNVIEDAKDLTRKIAVKTRVTTGRNKKPEIDQPPIEDVTYEEVETKKEQP